MDANSTGLEGDEEGININATTLSKLKTYFEEAEDSGKEGLEEDEFVSLLSKVLKKNAASNRQELTHLFMKIDANSDGSVDWDEFTNFLLMENQSNADMEFANPDLYVRSPLAAPESAQYYHKDMIESVLYLQKAEKYVTCSRDSTVKVWNAKDLSHTRTVRVGNSWLTSSCFLPHSNRIAVFSVDLTVSFFDANSFELVSRFSDNPSTRNNDKSIVELKTSQRKNTHAHRSKHLLTSLPISVTTIPSPDTDILAVGDAVGSISLYNLSGKWHACDGNLPQCSHEAPKRPGVSKRMIEHIHDDWITQMTFIPDLDALVTSSLDHTIKFCDIDKWQTNPVRKKFTGHSKGIYSFDYCKGYKFIASCGLSRRVVVWDPYRCREINTLSGHNASVQKVLVNEDKHQIVSLSVDKIIKVWDVRNFKCIQTIANDQHYRPENRISCLTLNPVYNCLLIGTNKLEMLPLKSFSMKEAHSHDAPLCSALYNRSFHQVVSADTSSVLKVWNFFTGAEVFWFAKAHGSSKITSMHFDEGKRRLLSGAEDGTVKIWNFSNGQCLSRFIDRDQPMHSEITALGVIADTRRGCSTNYVLATGWDKSIRIWQDSGEYESEPFSRMPSSQSSVGIKHTADVLCLEVIRRNELATGDYNGSIIIWSWDTKKGIKKLRPSESCIQNTTPHERAVEALVFLECYSILLSCGTDAVVRLWDSDSNWTLVHEYHMPRSRKNKEALLAMCAAEEGKYVCTGDAAGFISVIDISSLAQTNYNGVHEHIVFRAHQKGIVSVDYVSSYKMLLSASTDHKVKLWTEEGALVGMFGQESGLWDVKDPSTWTQQEPQPVVFAPDSDSEEEEVDEVDNVKGSEEEFGSVEFDYAAYLQKVRSTQASSSHCLRKAAPAVDIKNQISTAAQSATSLRIHRLLNLAEVADVPQCGYQGAKPNKEVRHRKRT